MSIHVAKRFVLFPPTTPVRHAIIVGTHVQYAVVRAHKIEPVYAIVEGELSSSSLLTTSHFKRVSFGRVSARFGSVGPLTSLSSLSARSPINMILTSRYDCLARSVSHPPVSCLASVVVSVSIFELIRFVQHLAGFGAACLKSDKTSERFSGITAHTHSVAPTVAIHAPSTRDQFVSNLQKASSGRSPLDSIVGQFSCRLL